MAAMSVIGIDFGNESCYIAAARAGGIETIANDYSLRATPSCVAFSDRNRILGVAAKNQTVTNMKNTIHGFKRLIGKKFNDPSVQNELKFLPYNVVDVNGTIGIKVQYSGEEKIFSPEQITAMLLTKLRETSEIALQCNINDCVLSVPSFYTDVERKSLLDAAKIAGLRVLRLFNETTATALTYGMYKQDLPSPEEPPRNVVFVDCGHSSLQVYAVAFHKEKLKLIGCAADPYLGGRNIDLILAKHFCQEFKKKYNIEPETNPRAFLRLLTEVEKLKKQMSANSTKLPLGIECFMNDIDVKAEMNRAEMEGLCSDIFNNVEKTMQKCLEKTKLDLKDIHSVEIVGGSSRIPAIKALIEKVFQKTPSTTLNQDEAVARGCALQCAMISPAVRVRDFSITDLQIYPVMIRLVRSEDDDSNNGFEPILVFPEMHPAPSSRVLCFYQDKPFKLELFYRDEVPSSTNVIGLYDIKDVKPGPDNSSQKIKIKFRVNMDGIISIIDVSMKERVETAEEEIMEVENEDKESKNGETPASNESPDTDEAKSDKVQSNQPEDPEKKTEEKKKKTVTKSIDLNFNAKTFTLKPDELNLLIELEGKMIADDKLEKERIDARNCLEEFVYDLRNKIGAEEYGLYVNSDDSSKILSQLDEIENWLYEEGADVNKSIYVSKLDELKIIGEQIRKRKIDFEEKTKAFENLFCSIQIAQKKILMFKENDERFNHLDKTEVQNVENKVADTLKWAENAQSLMNEFTDKTQDAPVPTVDIKGEMTALNNVVNPVFSKPKQQPKVEEKESSGISEPTEAAAEPMDESSAETNESATEKGKSA